MIVTTIRMIIFFIKSPKIIERFIHTRDRWLSVVTKKMGALR
jgi:hypothetical protein